jgi:hypothetical protein
MVDRLELHDDALVAKKVRSVADLQLVSLVVHRQWRLPNVGYSSNLKLQFQR